MIPFQILGPGGVRGPLRPEVGFLQQEHLGASGLVGRSRARAQAGRSGLCGPEQPALACASTGPGTDMLTT